MGAYADKNKVDFCLALGDNFYFAGVDSVDSHRFKDTFEDVYAAESLK